MSSPNPPPTWPQFFAIAASLAFAVTLSGQIPAFPGAEGFGAFAKGGRGGDVYTVTNLDGSGPGSFAEGVATAPEAGRTIVFAVSGYIPVPGKNLRLTRPRLTIAGQTAPGDGIGFQGGTVLLSAPDIVIRHVRFRHGRRGAGGDCVNLDANANDVLLDHVSMQFSTDENMSSFKRPPDRLTLQDSINAWGLQNHSCGGLWDQFHATSLRNLWAHNHTRNPKARPLGLLDWVNNVTYDWNIGFILGDSLTPMDWRANVVGNYFISPPGNLRPHALEKARLDREGNPNFTLHVSDNLIDNDGDDRLDGRDIGHAIASGIYTHAPVRLTAPHRGPLTILPARLAYKRVVSSAGALRLDARSDRPLRDAVDTHLHDNLLQLRRGMIGDERELPVPGDGMDVLSSIPAPTDTDGDGLPDRWETALGYDPSTPDQNHPLPSLGGLCAPGKTFLPDHSPDGYLRLDEYLHFLASPHAILAPGETVTVDLSRYTLGFNSRSPAFSLSSVAGVTANLTDTGGRLVTFTPAPNHTGRARFDFTVTDADGDQWTQTMLLLVAPVSASF